MSFIIAAAQCIVFVKIKPTAQPTLLFLHLGKA
jgi:hypothetical protein